MKLYSDPGNDQYKRPDGRIPRKYPSPRPRPVRTVTDIQHDIQNLDDAIRRDSQEITEFEKTLLNPDPVKREAASSTARGRYHALKSRLLRAKNARSSLHSELLHVQMKIKLEEIRPTSKATGEPLDVFDESEVIHLGKNDNGMHTYEYRGARFASQEPLPAEFFKNQRIPKPKKVPPKPHPQEKADSAFDIDNIAMMWNTSASEGVGSSSEPDLADVSHSFKFSSAGLTTSIDGTVIWDNYDSLLQRRVNAYMQEPNNSNLHNILSSIDYPKPWPKWRDIENISIKNGNLEILLYDSESESSEDEFDESDSSRYGIQSTRHKVGRRDSLYDPNRESRAVPVYKSGATPTGRTLRIRDEAGDNNNSTQQQS